MKMENTSHMQRQKNIEASVVFTDIFFSSCDHQSEFKTFLYLEMKDFFRLYFFNVFVGDR